MQSPRPQMLISVPMARIFIIEDNPELREMLCRLMVAEGHLVTLACNGQEAQTLDWKQPPDLLMTDIYMPDRDGLEVISDFAETTSSHQNHRDHRPRYCRWCVGNGDCSRRRPSTHEAVSAGGTGGDRE